MSTFSYFVDKLSPELRVMIYGYVFGPCEYVKRSTLLDEEPIEDMRLVLHEVKPATPPEPVHTSILDTNKLISEEALETFYNSKTIRPTCAQLCDEASSAYMRSLRKLELFRISSATSKEELTKALSIAEGLPRVKSIVILSDTLALDGPDLSHVTVHDWASAIGMEAVCVDIGVYELKGYTKVEIVNSRLARLWSLVGGMPDDFDVLEEIEDIAQEWDVNANNTVWASQTSFRLWLGMLEYSLRQPANSELRRGNDDRAKGIRNFHVLRWRGAVTGCSQEELHSSGSRYPGLRVSRLGSGDDPDALAWATELIVCNIESYEHLDEENTTSATARSYWPELEGGDGLGVLENK